MSASGVSWQESRDGVEKFFFKFLFLYHDILRNITKNKLTLISTHANYA